jgi:hypothetical protein
VDSGKVKISFPKSAVFTSGQTGLDKNPSNGDRYEYTTPINTLLADPDFKVKLFDTKEIFSPCTTDDKCEAILFSDSIVISPAILFLKSRSFRILDIQARETDTPTFNAGIETKPSLEVEKIKGTFSIKEHTGSGLHTKFDVSDLKSSLTNIDSIAVGMEGATIKVVIDNPTGIEFKDNSSPTLSINYWNGVTKGGNYTDKPIKIKPLDTTMLIIRIDDILGNANLLDIDSLTFSLKVPDDDLANQELYMDGEESTLSLAYDLEMKNMLKDFYVKFVDTADINIGSDGMKGIKGTLNLTLDCENTLPLEVGIDVKALDENHNEISGVKVEFPDGNKVKASPGGILTVRLTQSDPTGDALGKLKALRIEAILKGEGNGDLYSTDYLLVKIRLATEGIEVDVDKMMDK